MMQPNEKGARKDLVLYRIETSRSNRTIWRSLTIENNPSRICILRKNEKRLAREQRKLSISGQ